MTPNLAHDDPRVGQPYPRQWWCRYVDAPTAPHDKPKGVSRLKQNRFTRQWFVFVMKDEGNRWNEPGYGWGVWVPLAHLATAR